MSEEEWDPNNFFLNDFTTCNWVARWQLISVEATTRKKYYNSLITILNVKWFQLVYGVDLIWLDFMEKRRKEYNGGIF